jgi:hypothetical protein
MTATTTRAKANGRAKRNPRLVNWLLKGEGYGTIKIGEIFPRKGEVSHAYYVQALEADFGIGCHMVKLTPDSEDTYSVNYHPVSGEKICDCKGHLAHGHCRHADALEALVNAGRWFD